MNKTYKIVTYNLAHGMYNEKYCSKLGIYEHKKIIKETINNQINILKQSNADYILLQESGNLFLPYFLNQSRLITNSLKYNSFYSANFNLLLSKVGNQILTKYNVKFYKKIIPYKMNKHKDNLVWRNKSFIYLVDDIKNIVIFNIHLCAHNENNIRKKQLEYIFNVAQKFYTQGYGVIIGGDFNFSLNNDKKYNNWNYIVSKKETLRHITNKKLFFTDGFLCSPNIIIKNITCLENFKYSDHSPVELLLVK